MSTEVEIIRTDIHVYTCMLCVIGETVCIVLYVCRLTVSFSRIDGVYITVKTAIGKEERKKVTRSKTTCPG
jgi:hypothetical protein